MVTDVPIKHAVKELVEVCNSGCYFNILNHKFVLVLLDQLCINNVYVYAYVYVQTLIH